MDAANRGGSYPNVAVFMERFEVHERTVRGDLAFMRERLKAPLEHDRRRGGAYRPHTLDKMAWLMCRGSSARRETGTSTGWATAPVS